MQDEEYSIDGQWPKFESQNDMFDWLSEQRALKEGRYAARDVSGIFPDPDGSSSEALSVG